MMMCCDDFDEDWEGILSWDILVFMSRCVRVSS
jgi:hypothetical protein